MTLSIFLFEFKHFIRIKAKLFSYLFFILLCVISIYNGFGIMQKQTDTINEIKSNQEIEFLKVTEWIESKDKGPANKTWINVEDPYWAIRSTPSYSFKNPSLLFPLGIGQSDQFGFYKKVNRWSSTYDSDMGEEISNYERLINGNIDFSFLVIFLLPILMIILVYNVNGLEKDLNFHKLISIQTKRIKFWILNRFLFYILLIICSINILIFSVGLINYEYLDFRSIIELVLISNLYIIAFSLIFFYLNIYAKSSSSSAFKMISVWLFFCVIVPGSVQQFASMKYPVNYMTEFLDTNRKHTYDIFKLDNSELYSILLNVHPNLANYNIININSRNKKIRRSISTIINQMNLNAVNQIEEKNEKKNILIQSTYLFNPISYIQNLWNNCTSTDYKSYRVYRKEIQKSISLRNDLIVSEIWKENTVDKIKYEEYLKILNN